MNISRYTWPLNTAVSASSLCVRSNSRSRQSLILSQTSGVYTATLDPTYHGLLDEDALRAGKNDAYRIPRSSIDAGLSHPYITFTSLPFYHDRRQLSKVTCVQLTETKLFFVWDAMYKPENIDFFRQLGMIGGSPPVPSTLR